MQRQGTGSDQCGVFAKAVACQHRRPLAALRVPQAPHRHTGGQQRRLGVFGAVEHLFRAALRQGPQIDAGAIGGLDEGLADLRMQFGKFSQHAQGLRALAGKHESERRFGHALLPTKIEPG